jgi:Protein of unknown function (DUF2806)
MELPGEKTLVSLIDKVYDLTKSGVGAVFRPALKILDGKADARVREIERLAQERLRQQVKGIRAGRVKVTADFKTVDVIPAPMGEATAIAVHETAQRLMEAMSASGYRPSDLIEIERQINLAQIAAFAEDEAEQEKDGTAAADEVDDDWFAQWRNRAQDVSKEAKRPGTFSVHTMDFLSRMSASEADLIAMLAPFAISRRHIFWSRTDGTLNSVLISSGLTLSRLLELEDLGIVNSVSGLGLKSTTNLADDGGGGRTCGLAVGKSALVFLVTIDSGLHQIAYQSIPISRLGNELLQLIDCEANVAYLKSLVRSVRVEGMTVYIGELAAATDGSADLEVINLKPFATDDQPQGSAP